MTILFFFIGLVTGFFWMLVAAAFVVRDKNDRNRELVLMIGDLILEKLALQITIDKLIERGIKPMNTASSAWRS